MYQVDITITDGQVCSFNCNSFTESYDNSVQRKSLTFISKEHLDVFIQQFTILEQQTISSISISFDDKEIAKYTTYSRYDTASIQYPENNPKDAQGIITILV